MNVFTTREVDAVKPTHSDRQFCPRPSVLPALLALVAFVSACGPQDPSSPAEASLGESGAELTTTSSPAYAGCYTDSATRALPTKLASSGATVENCIAAAAAKNLAYAGVQYGGECFGGNTLGYTLVANSECSMPCQANSGETCGGTWRNSIYRTANYKGCYTDDAKRALPTLLLSSGATVEACIAAAKAANLPYAGVQYGGECFGGNTLGYTLVANSDCNMPCRANRGEICGGSWRNSVYSTAVSAPAPSPTPTPTPTPTPIPTPVISFFTASPTTITAGQSTTLTWSASNATSVVIEPDVGPAPGASVTVSPATTTTYTLTASGNGTAIAKVTVTVRPAGQSFVYPLAPGGREWYLPDNANRNADREFVPETKDITVVQTGSPTVYHTVGYGSNNQIRLNVHSPAGKAWWRNVEMTAYYRVTGVSGANYPQVDFEIRGERHTSSSVTKSSINDGIAPPAGTALWKWWNSVAGTDSVVGPALGTAYHGIFYISHASDPAWAQVSKEISHPNGYTPAQRVQTTKLMPPVGQWFGAKFVARNDAATNSRVKVELWFDANAAGTWTKVKEYIDQGGWSASNLDGTGAASYSIAPDQIITWAGPYARFRADNVAFDFKQWSVREIDPY